MGYVSFTGVGMDRSPRKEGWARLFNEDHSHQIEIERTLKAIHPDPLLHKREN